MARLPAARRQLKRRQREREGYQRHALYWVGIATAFVSLLRANAGWTQRIFTGDVVASYYDTILPTLRLIHNTQHDNHNNATITTTTTTITTTTLATVTTATATTNTASFTSTPALFSPPACTAEQLAMIEYQLPADGCLQHAHKPFWGGGWCSFSWATRCPEPRWLEQYFRTLQLQQLQRPLRAVYVGCNKGFDAVNTLRMLSNDPTIDKAAWANAFFTTTASAAVTGAFNTATTIAGFFEQGRCQQEQSGQWQIFAAVPVTTANVYCIEAMPSTARQLQAAASTLRYDERGFQVVHAAMGQTDGRIRFPSLTKVGVEDKGMGDCNHQLPDTSRDDGCEVVPMLSLDTFLRDAVPTNGDNTDNNNMIDFLSVDVEGFDWPVLLGAADTLARRVKYLEFEYNWKGPWSSTPLSMVIMALQQHHGFVCYWAGARGHLWRITDCFLPHYDKHYWSNVACVNGRLQQADILARGMEDMFQKTLRAERTIRYDHETR